MITGSNAMQDDLVRHGWPQAKINVVWNGVDPDRYNPKASPKKDVSEIRKAYGIADVVKMLLFLGRRTWVKSVKNLVQALPLVLKDYPKTKLVILGKGEEQSDIVETANRLGVKDHVVYRFEFVPEDQRILHYAASDVC